jgi:hypothetical protein
MFFVAFFCIQTTAYSQSWQAFVEVGAKYGSITQGDGSLKESMGGVSLQVGPEITFTPKFSISTGAGFLYDTIHRSFTRTALYVAPHYYLVGGPAMHQSGSDFASVKRVQNFGLALSTKFEISAYDVFSENSEISYEGNCIESSLGILSHLRISKSLSISGEVYFQPLSTSFGKTKIRVESYSFISGISLRI